VKGQGHTHRVKKSAKSRDDTAMQCRLVALCRRSTRRRRTAVSLPAGVAKLPVLFLLMADFWVFHPAGATRCTDQGEIWQGADPAKFHLDLLRGVGLRPSKL